MSLDEKQLKRDAKDLAFLFFNSFSVKYNNQLIAKTLVQAKSLLEMGYTKEDVENTIEYLAQIKQDVYSFGFINKTISQYVHKANYEKERKNAVKKEVEISLKGIIGNKNKTTTYKMPSWLDTEMFGGD